VRIIKWTKIDFDAKWQCEDLPTSKWKAGYWISVSASKSLDAGPRLDWARLKANRVVGLKTELIKKVRRAKICPWIFFSPIKFYRRFRWNVSMKWLKPLNRGLASCVTTWGAKTCCRQLMSASRSRMILELKTRKTWLRWQRFNGFAGVVGMHVCKGDALFFILLIFFLHLGISLKYVHTITIRFKFQRTALQCTKP
jgi:hypothetical protein